MDINVRDLSEVLCNYITYMCFCFKWKSTINKIHVFFSRFFFFVFQNGQTIFAEHKELSPKERCDYKIQFPQWLSILDGAFL